MRDVAVRDAQWDAEGCAEIYRHYVTSTAVTFELVPPDVDQVRERIGVLRRIGYKNGAWHDVAIHQLELATPSDTPVEPR